MSDNGQTIQSQMIDLGRRARKASRLMASASTRQKNAALSALAVQINNHRQSLMNANAADVARAKTAGQDPAFIDRLTLSNSAIDTMIEGIQQIMALPDPIGEITHLSKRPTGISVGHMRVPLGFIGIICE